MLVPASVVRELYALVRLRGKPACMFIDKGRKFTRRAFLKWADKNSFSPLCHRNCGKRGLSWHSLT